MRMTHNFINYSKLFCHIFVLLTKLGSAFLQKMKCAKVVQIWMILFSLFKNINIKVVQKLENYIYQSVPINEATPSAICKKKVCFSNKTCHICNIICCDFFCLHIMYNEIQFHAEEAQNSIMIVLFMPNLPDLKSIKRNVLLEKVHTCK